MFLHFFCARHHRQSPLRSQEENRMDLGAKIRSNLLSCASPSFTCRGLKLGALDPEILVRSGLGDVSAPAWLRHRPLSKTLIVKVEAAGLRREALQALSCGRSLSHTRVPAAGALRPRPRRQDPSKQPRPLRSVQGGVCPRGKLPPLRSLIRVQLSSVPHTNWVLFCRPQ